MARRLFSPVVVAGAAAAVAGSAALWVLLSWRYPRLTDTQRWQAVLAGLLVGIIASVLGGIIASFLVAAVASGNRTALRWLGRAGRMLPVIGVVAVVLAVAACDSSTTSDGAPRPPESSLVQREPSRPATESYPAVASLIKPRQEGDRHACAASVVSRTHVLTAAHCVTDQDGAVEDHTRMRVRIGSAQWRTGGLVTAVAAVEVFPGFHGDALHPPARYGDLALLRLATTVDVAPFPLAVTAGMSVPTRVIGWGIEVDDRRPLLPDGVAPMAETLHEIDGVTTAGSQCAAIWITDAELCVGYNRQATCGGDSGSPVLQQIGGRWHLVGLVSHSYGLVPRCERAFPGDAVTDLTDADHLAWITRVACVRELSDPSPCGSPGPEPRTPAGGNP